MELRLQRRRSQMGLAFEASFESAFRRIVLFLCSESPVFRGSQKFGSIFVKPSILFPVHRNCKTFQIGVNHSSQSVVNTRKRGFSGRRIFEAFHGLGQNRLVCRGYSNHVRRSFKRHVVLTKMPRSLHPSLLLTAILLLLATVA